MHKILNDIKLVAFDIMGVIITEPSMVRNGLYPIYKDKFSYDYIKGLYNKAKIDVDGDKVLWDGLGVDDIESAREKFLTIFKKDSGFEEFRDYLSNRGLRKGVISNMPENFGDYFINKFKLNIDFDPILISADIGVAKPDYGKYDEFLNRAKVRGDEVLFIDDKLKNLKMGKMFGFKTVQFYRNEQEEDYMPDLVIESFKELM
jgi:HAD superfamily hydrolase (TIGR01549 family)